MKRERLSKTQEVWLVMVEAAGKEGRSASSKHRTMLALQRRALVEPRHCRSSLDSRRWIVTWAGREWVRGRDKAPGERTRWAAEWSEATRG